MISRLTDEEGDEQALSVEERGERIPGRFPAAVAAAGADADRVSQDEIAVCDGPATLLLQDLRPYVQRVLVTE